jgi:hypothetical protein
MQRYCSLFLGVVLISSAIGCGQSGFNVAPVHGTVTANDKPLFQGRVMFAPSAKGENIQPGKPAWGDIDKNGNYRLSTFAPNDGAVIGDHWVTVINSSEELPDGVPEFSRIVLPKRMAVVAGKDNQLDIKLTSKTIKENREDDR